jgi:mannose-6-phosphate isomerase-like protein (cupin superfamily)
MTVEMDRHRVRAMPAHERAGYAPQVIRFEELIPNWRAFPEAHLPENHRGFYQYIGPGASDNPMSAVAIGENFPFGIVVAGPGRGAPLHAHTTEEVFVALAGRWQVYWGEPDDQTVLTLEPYDAVTVPAPVMRGFRNAGRGDGFLMALLGGGMPPPPIYHPTVLEQIGAPPHTP